MPVLTGTPSLVIASRVQVYHSCSVDLTWQRAVHSCQRCPRAALVRSAVTMPAVTQSHVERTHSRFCPAGVHMGSCVPASEVFAPSPKHSLSKPQTTLTNGDKTRPVTVGSIGSELMPSVWGPNLPLPAASPLHPVHAAHLARASYPPATPASFTSISSVNAPSVHHFVPVRRVKVTAPSEPKTAADTNDLSKTLVKDVDSSEVQQTPRTLTERPPSDQIVVPTVTIVREPQVVELPANSSDIIKKPVSGVEPTTVDVSPVVNKEENINTSAQQPEGLASTRSSEDSSVKKFRDDGSTFYSSKSRNVADSLHGYIDDTSAQEYVTAKTATNEDHVRSSKVASKATERVVSKQLVPTAAPDVELSRPDSLQTQTRSHCGLTSAREAVRPQISSLGAGGIGDVGPISAKPNGVHLEQIHHVAPDLPAASAPKHSVASSVRKPVPSFHFPLGTTRMTKEEIAFELERAKRELIRVTEQLIPMESKKSTEALIPYSNFGHVAKALNCPFYWKYLVYTASGGTSDHRALPVSSILKMWQQVLTNCPDETARFVHMLTGGRSTYLIPSNFDPLIQDILESHPGLEFLREAEDFHSRYVATVVSRIFFNVNSSWSGRISLAELRRSNFLSVLASLEDERDINLVTQYFSYEHFYVIYCKFWELDDDHDLIISRSDLARHNNYAISERMIDRIFSGTVTRGDAFKEGVMQYTDFVWFLLAEEDKRHPRSIEYWFRCMDLDGDGLLSMYELEYFYSEQLARMEEMGIEPISFEDCLCQCLDMVKPVLGDKIRLSDMKRCRLCHIFFDTFFNLPKYLQHEQRDPFANLRDIEEGLNELSDWDRYAAEAYELLITIENGNQEDGVDEDDGDEDELDDAVLATPSTVATSKADIKLTQAGHGTVNNKMENKTSDAGAGE